jgi:hypothetical protein
MVADSIMADFTEDTQQKTKRKKLVSALFRQYGCCFGLFDID